MTVVFTIFFVALYGGATIFVFLRLVNQIKKIPLEECLAKCKLKSEDIAIIAENKRSDWSKEGVSIFALLNAYSEASILTPR